MKPNYIETNCAGHSCPQCGRIHYCATGCQKPAKRVVCGQCDTRELFPLAPFVSLVPTRKQELGPQLNFFSRYKS